MDRKLTIEATEAELQALLRALPRCVGCGGLAEVTIGKRPRCVACAAPHKRGRCSSLSHAGVALRIEDVLSPYLPSPRKRG